MIANASSFKAVDDQSPRVFLVAGEHSGDALGAKLLGELRRRCGSQLIVAGVGGQGMEEEGLAPLFPMEEVAVMGPLNILPKLRHIIRRINETARAAVAWDPHVVVIIDSPEFTHPIARRIRKRAPHIPIVDYVSPSVWAWRPGRARKMRAYVDHVLALLPFEPEAHARLGGPACTYVGHPLSERLDWIAALDPNALRDRLGLDPARAVLVVLPGSRASEVTRLMRPFGETVARVARAHPHGVSVVLPVVPSVRALVEAEMQRWSHPVTLIESEADKFAAFRLADAALAASGTVTLELAVCGTPAVVAYKVDWIASRLRFLLKVPSIVLANLVAGERIYPEHIQEEAEPEILARSLAPLLIDSPERRRQRDLLRAIPGRLALADSTPSARAADVVLALATRGRLPVG